jgi:hypothetical protein
MGNEFPPRTSAQELHRVGVRLALLPWLYLPLSQYLPVIPRAPHSLSRPSRDSISIASASWQLNLEIDSCPKPCSSKKGPSLESPTRPSYGALLSPAVRSSLIPCPPPLLRPPSLSPLLLPGCPRGRGPCQGAGAGVRPRHARGV